MSLFSYKRVVIAVFLMSFHLFFLNTVDLFGQTGSDPFIEVKKKLVKDGFKKEFIQKVFGSEKVAFEKKGVSLFFMHNESKLNYNQFFNKENINKARIYMKKYRKPLIAAKKESGVDPKVITAIILVETRLGTHVGTRSVLNTLSTMASMAEKETRQTIWNSIPKEKRFSSKKFEKKADMRSTWAYKELKAFLKYVQSESLDPYNIKGSYAGALGIGQFTPTNVLKLAKDGNKDGRIDLFNHSDAISSVANYLKFHGWKPGISRKRAKKVIYHYNHSSYYVDTILKISDRLEGKNG